MGRANDLQGVEDSLKAKLPELKKKRLALFKEMLECSKHKKATIVADMAGGFHLSGPIPASGAYRAKRASATLSFWLSGADTF